MQINKNKFFILTLFISFCAIIDSKQHSKSPAFGGGGYFFIMSILNDTPYVVELESQENNHTNTVYIPDQNEHCTIANHSCAVNTGCSPIRIKPHASIELMRGNEAGFVIPWQIYGKVLKLTVYNDMKNPTIYYLQDQQNNLVVVNKDFSKYQILYDKFQPFTPDKVDAIDHEDVGIAIEIKIDPKKSNKPDGLLLQTKIVYAKAMGYGEKARKASDLASADDLKDINKSGYQTLEII